MVHVVTYTISEHVEDGVYEKSTRTKILNSEGIKKITNKGNAVITLMSPLKKQHVVTYTISEHIEDGVYDKSTRTKTLTAAQIKNLINETNAVITLMRELN